MAERVELAPGDVIASLKAATIFSVLEPSELVAIAPLFGAVRFRAGETVASAGDVEDDLWVVSSGVVATVAPKGRGTDASPAHLSFGDAIGTRGVFTGDPRSSTAVVTEDAVLLRSSRDALLAVLAADPSLFDRLVLDDDVRQRISVAELPSAAAGEYRVALYRRHWMVLARRMAAPVILLAITMAGAFAVSYFTAVGARASPPLLALIALIAVAIPVALGMWSFFDYYHDVLIVTSRRIVHVERTPLVDAQRTEAFLTRIQDVNTTVPSLAARLLGYGNLFVQTASTGGQIVFPYVPHPDDARATIMRQMEQARAADRRERDEWVNERVRRAIGLADIDNLDEPGPARAGAGVPGGAAPGFAALVMESLLQMAAYFWPKMRLEQGAVVTWRKHWIVLVRSMILPGILLLALAVAAIVLSGGDVRIPLWLVFVTLLLVGGWMLWRYENWRNDLYQITDEHVIDIERLPFGFFEERRQASLAQIQDVKYRVPNPVATLLNYGNVVIQTAAEEGSFTFDHVHAPSAVQSEIFSRIQRHQERLRKEEEERRAEEMVVWLRTYHDIAGGDAPEGTRPGWTGLGAE